MLIEGYKIWRKLAFTLLISIVLSSSFYTKIIHNTDPEAKCLDGSPPAIYVHEGGDTSRILIYMLGGGACVGNTL